MFALDSAIGRRFGVVFSLALASLVSGCAVSEANAPALESSQVVALESAELAIEAPALVPEPAPVIAEPVVETPIRCLGPEPTGRWADRSSDDEWARGLYPARESYPEKWLALTFDDGPHPSRTKVVLDELARHGQRGTFFLTGHAIRPGTYRLVQRMVAEGHTLANHGWRHDIDMVDQIADVAELESYIESELELTQILVDIAMLASSREDFESMERRVFTGLHWTDERAVQLAAMPELRERHRELLGERGYTDGARPLVLEWMRPPGGNPYVGKRWTVDEREAFARVVNRMHLSVVMWNHGSGDSDPALDPEQRMNPERVAETGRKAGRRGGIYVAHDRIDPEAAKALLKAVAASGAQVVDLEQLRQAKLEAAGWCG